MKYGIELSDSIEKTFEKLSKKNRKQLSIIHNKVEEIRMNPFHYKPLKGDMKNIRRVHIDSSFVLTFEIDEKDKKIRILDYEHHDRIYH